MKKRLFLNVLIFLLFVAFVNAESLPIVSSEAQRDQHGNILNNYLLVTHTENGTLKNNSVQDYMLNLSNITLLDFTNDANFLTTVATANIQDNAVKQSKLNLSDITLADFTNDRLDLWSLLNFTNSFANRLSELWNFGNFTRAYANEYASTGYKKANVTVDYPNLDLNLGDDYSLTNFTSNFGSRLTEFFNLGNYSTEYSSTGYKLANFTANYDSRTDRFGNINFSALYDNEASTRFLIINFTASYENQVYWRIANQTAREGAYFKYSNFTSLQSTNATHAACWKTATALGFCVTAPNAIGECTCI